MSRVSTSSAFSLINGLASRRSVHDAFRWLHLNGKQIMQWQTEMVAIPAPPFGEKARALWVAQRFREIGLQKVTLDSLGNVLATYPSASQAEVTEAVRPCILLSAHIDTVFPADTPLAPKLKGNRLYSPGACDNGAGVVGLFALASALQEVKYDVPADLIFLANVGEEGEGNLRGMRHIYQSPLKNRIAANIVLDGAGHETVVTQALGSRRFLVAIHGPGGHSFTDSGTPNPIAALSSAIARFYTVPLPEDPRTTVNIGTIEGGTSVNSIPEQVSARIDLRSIDSEQLIRLEVELHRAVEDAVMDANQLASANARGKLTFKIEKIGDRPAAKLPSDSPILDTLRAVDRHLNIKTGTRLGSTDANIPLSLGVMALSMGAGGDGGGAHTTAEWYDATNREMGLRRVLLLALAMLERAAELP
jgi:tripeptide aminopeptidase